MATTILDSDKARLGGIEQPSAGIIVSAVYLTHEAARLCRVKPSTIRHAVRQGAIRGRGRPFRILGSELLKFVS